MAIIALVLAVTDSAAAIEPGLLLLPGETAPVTESGEAKAISLLKTPSGSIECSETKSTATGGTKGETHDDLAEGNFNNKGCKQVKAACTSEDSEGNKDPKGVILLIGAFTDVHSVALLNGTTLVPGHLIILLDLGKSPLLISCGLTKVLVLGVIVVEYKEVAGQPLTGDVTEVIVNYAEKPLPCDTADKACKELIAKFGANLGEKACPLGVKFAEKYECATYTLTQELAFNPMVLIDF
jgi:hypothetical protein